MSASSTAGLPATSRFDVGPLRFEPAIPDDLPAWKGFAQDPEVTRFIKGGWSPDHAELAQFLQRNLVTWRRHDMGWWSVRQRESADVIGSCVLNVSCSEASEIGYIVRRASWQQGFGTQIVLALCRYAFEELRLDAIKAYVNVDNAGSIRILENLGFRRTAEAVFSGRRCHRFDLRSRDCAALEAAPTGPA